MEMDERTFRLSNEEAVTVLPWSTITELWRFERFWLIFYSPAQFNILPLASVDEDARNFIADQVQRHGGRLN